MRFLSKRALNGALESLVAFGKREAGGLNSVTKRRRFSRAKFQVHLSPKAQRTTATLLYVTPGEKLSCSVSKSDGTNEYEHFL